MQDFRYLPNVSTLKLNTQKCIGCGQCTQVCPHGVLELSNGKAEIVDLDGCMECGACAHNCPVEALELTPGVGCATLIIKKWLKKDKQSEYTSVSCC